MTDSRGIAAVTVALRDLLAREVPERDEELRDLSVTAFAPDQARRGVTTAQLNLFLYQVAPNAAWRSFDPRARAGEPGPPPLALDLRYLLTAWGRGETDGGPIGHRALGAALAAVHDAAALDDAALRDVLGDAQPLPSFVERVRLSPAPLGIEELSKLWTAFQTGYRLSAACEATVVLIESRRPRRVGPPVLRRGPADRGPQAGTERAPVLAALHPPAGRPALEPGEVLRVEGAGISAAVSLEVEPLGGGAQARLPLVRGEDGSWGATLAPDALPWQPGFWRARLVRPLEAGRAWTSAALAFAVAPRLVGFSHAADGAALEVTADAAPPLATGQRAELVLGRAPAVPDVSRSAAQVQPAGGGAAVPVTRLVFRPPRPADGRHAVRLRVDGVENRGDAPDPNDGLPAPDPALDLVLP